MPDEVALGQIQLPSVASVVYDVIRREILHGRLAQNQQLNLNRLGQQLGVSRTPLKMALSRLLEEGLVDIHPRRGTYVKTFSESDIRECFDLRIALEAHALRRAFEPENAGLLGEIIDLFLRMENYFTSAETYIDSMITFMDMDRAAHVKIAELSGNSRIVQTYERTNVQGYIGLMGSRFEFADTLTTRGEHHLILQALQACDLNVLLEAAREHLKRAGERAVFRLIAKQDGG